MDMPRHSLACLRIGRKLHNASPPEDLGSDIVCQIPYRGLFFSPGPKLKRGIKWWCSLRGDIPGLWSSVATPACPFSALLGIPGRVWGPVSGAKAA